MVFTKTILKEGTGDGCQTGNKIKMHYTGWVKDTSKPDNRGSKYVIWTTSIHSNIKLWLNSVPKRFDSSHDRGPPFEAKLDVGQLIKGTACIGLFSFRDHMFSNKIQVGTREFSA